ncbi:cell wall-binding repeat-containing protein [Thermococcus prieurii]
MKKLASFVIMLMLLTWGAAFSTATASGGGSDTVILVSDNSADLVMAELVSNLTGYPIVVAPWGIYDPGVTAKVLSKSPRKVIIIGGPLAVLPDYAADLNASNVTVIRWGGRTRYDTNRDVIKGLRELGINLKKQVFAVGSDPACVQTALKLALEERAAVVYLTKPTENISNGKLVVPQWVNVSGPEVVKVKVTNWTAEMRIKEVEGKLNFLLGFINGTPGEVLGKYVDDAKKLLAEAKEAYARGNYAEAYRLANLAGEKVELAIKQAALDPNVKADFDVSLMEFYMHGMKPLTPEQQEELQKLMKELEEALKNHDYKKARRIRLIIITRFLRVYGRFGGFISPIISPNLNDLNLDK